MINSADEYKEALRRLEQDRVVIAKQLEILKSMDLTQEEIDRGIEPMLCFHEGLKEKVEAYEKTQIMSASWRVKSVRVIESNALSVRFVDGLEGTVRFEAGFFRGVFAHLTDPLEFRKVSVINGAVTWPGGLDLAPDAMYEAIRQRGEWIVNE